MKQQKHTRKKKSLEKFCYSKNFDDKKEVWKHPKKKQRYQIATLFFVFLNVHFDSYFLQSLNLLHILRLLLNLFQKKN